MTTSAKSAQGGVHASAYGCITVPFLLIALVTLLWGARTHWAKGELLRGGQAVSGRVTELRYVASNPSVAENVRGGKGSGQSPVVAFTTRTGEARSMVGSVNRHPAPWTVGQVVDVVYDPADPGRADVRTELEGWSLWFGFWCAVAAVPAVIAFLPVALRLRERRA